ncbi:hypothetical protein [Roseateles toxinivorans]|uniref:Uncharacterized protein n=1 Tax=Roseateles toxinivorans TaxID=270368 RepID=A0A4R6QGA5_9BURK|nr:hypothetical protein [Roseateles toxinivorans]TDP61864.1 hypothetical protein DES47_11076 [Roseateles toxinivorans]
MIQVHLRRDALQIDALLLRGSLLSRLLAALLQAHGEGLATLRAPCSRVDLRERISGLAELHRTQLWRLLQRLEATPLAALIAAEARSSGPFWLDAQRLAQCEFLIDGRPVTPDGLAALLGQAREAAHRPAAPACLPLACVEGLARADFLLDRGELYPARLALQAAAAHLPTDDAMAAVTLGLRRARIARRLGDWAALQDELRELGASLRQARMPAQARAQLGLRLQVLGAWHCYGSLGQAGAALQRLEQLEQVGEQALAWDMGLRGEYLNLRGLVLRELAIAGQSRAQAGEALACLAEALRCASLAGLPDALQIAAANLANALAQLLEAGLAGGAGQDLRDALGWLLLSDAVCARWQLGASSLLNTVFLLRMALPLDFAEVAALAAAQGQALPGSSFADLAARRWAACRAVHSQIPAAQRCAFFLMWAQHAAREGDVFAALELCDRVRHLSRKLRDVAARQAYGREADALQARLNAERGQQA